MLHGAAVGWALAAIAITIGYLQWGWAGVALAVTMIVFWLLLQFSRALRVLRNAGRAPVGRIDSAVMLAARLQRGQRLPQILALTRSLGTRAGGEHDGREVFEWRDAGDDVVRAELVRGRLVHWQLLRAAASPSD